MVKSDAYLIFTRVAWCPVIFKIKYYVSKKNKPDFKCLRTGMYQSRYEVSWYPHRTKRKNIVLFLLLLDSYNCSGTQDFRIQKKLSLVCFSKRGQPVSEKFWILLCLNVLIGRRLLRKPRKNGIKTSIFGHLGHHARHNALVFLWDILTHHTRTDFQGLKISR